MLSKAFVLINLDYEAFLSLFEVTSFCIPYIFLNISSLLIVYVCPNTVKDKLLGGENRKRSVRVINTLFCSINAPCLNLMILFLQIIN